MKKLIGSALLVFALIGANAMADDSAVLQKKITCDSVSSIDPYISVRGTLLVDDNSGFDNARANLRMDFGGANIVHVSVRGQYVSNGNIENADLEPLNFGDYGIEQIYIDFRDGVYEAGSWVTTLDGGIYKMSCYQTEP